MKFDLGKIDGRIFVVEGRGIAPTEIPQFSTPEELAVHLQELAERRGYVDILDGTSGTLVVKRLLKGRNNHGKQNEIRGPLPRS